MAGMNTYVYVNGNPINATDPMGLETWQCTQPLHALGHSNWNNYGLYHIPYLHHQYSCIVRNSIFQCGGQDRGENIGKITYEGIASEDIFPSKHGNCKKVVEDNDKFEGCLREQWSKTRPDYNVIPRLLRNSNSGSYNCQDYDDSVNAYCRNKYNVRTVDQNKALDLYNKFRGF